MDRKLLEHMLTKMKENLKQGKDIGNLKVGALFALGSQLEAIFYFSGHELGSKIGSDLPKAEDIEKIAEILKDVSSEYHLGGFKIDEMSNNHITFTLEDCNSCKDFPKDFKTEGTFCSFEAGVFAGIVEKISNKHCFAQELQCRLQGNVSCQFMIVIPE
ncbi:MAG: V4R domain-containing protein [Promethearchaeota archaeon]